MMCARFFHQDGGARDQVSASTGGTEPRWAPPTRKGDGDWGGRVSDGVAEVRQHAETARKLHLLRRLCTDAMCRHMPVDAPALFLQGLHEARVLVFTPRLFVQHVVCLSEAGHPAAVRILAGARTQTIVDDLSSHQKAHKCLLFPRFVFFALFMPGHSFPIRRPINVLFTSNPKYGRTGQSSVKKFGGKFRSDRDIHTSEKVT
jgi:hypothetical protein